MVFLFTSSKDTHPAVTNSSHALRPTTEIFHPHQRKSEIWKRNSFEHIPIISLNFHPKTDIFSTSIIRSERRWWSIVDICLRGFSDDCVSKKLFHSSFHHSAKGCKETCKGWDLSICSNELYADITNVIGPEIPKWVINTGQIASFFDHLTTLQKASHDQTKVMITHAFAYLQKGNYWAMVITV